MPPSPVFPAPLPRDVALWQKTLHWCPDGVTVQQFQALYEGILNGNQQMNLTRITAPEDFWEKHLWDSVSGLYPWLPDILDRPPWAQPEAIHRVIDIGTGAGFPGLPAAIAFPTWEVTLLDATQKKVRFLQELAQAMGLVQVRAVSDRAEQLAHQLQHREGYDLALIRAVGAAPTCAEFALPLVKVGGFAVLYRGQWTQADTAQIAPVAKQLGGRFTAALPWQTPLSSGIRHCIYLQKVSPTPEDYPRAVGTPAKHPLGNATAQ